MKSWKKNEFVRFALSVAAATVVCLWYQGCGSYSQTPTAIGTLGVPGFIGPGSGVWDAYVNTLAGVIELVHQPSIGGGNDYISISQAPIFPTGFTQMSIYSVGPGTNGAPVGSSSYALQIPGFALFMAPFGTPGSALGMIPPVCPAADMTVNFIKIRQPAGWANGAGNGDAFGTMTFAVAGNASLVNDFNLDSVANGDSSADVGASGLTGAPGCSNGTFADGSYESFASSSSVTIHSLINDAVYYGLVSGSTVTTASLAGNYGGILYQSGNSTNSALSLTLAVSGPNVTGVSSVLADVSSSTGTTGPTITLGSVTLTNAAASGFIAGSINFGGGNKPLVCLPQTSAGGSTQTLLVCNGEDAAAKFLSLVLVSH